MNYKLICIDMDGTLLNDKHEVSEENRIALKAAIEKGVKIAITTGRPFVAASQYAEKLGIKVSIIGSNGSYIREKDEEKVIFKHGLSQEQFNNICDVIEKYQLRKYFNTYDSVIANKELDEGHGYVISNNIAPEHLKIKIDIYEDLRDSYKKYGDELLKAIVIGEEVEVIQKIKNELKAKGGLEVVSSGYNNTEVMASGTSKGNGVKAFSEILGIKKEEIICIGDNENDISMIKYAGLGVAMGNATDEVKELANYITDTNNNSGVAKVIDKFILNK